jgi:hypothetical protein
MIGELVTVARVVYNKKTCRWSPWVATYWKTIEAAGKLACIDWTVILAPLIVT